MRRRIDQKQIGILDGVNKELRGRSRRQTDAVGDPSRFGSEGDDVLPARGVDEGGTLDQEVVATHASGDLVVLVAVEWVHAAVGGLPEQDWSLRVTQVFRRDGFGWQLVHRHADPLV